MKKMKPTLFFVRKILTADIGSKYFTKKNLYSGAQALISITHNYVPSYI